MALALPVGGCGITPPPAEKYFERSEGPLDTLKGFVYAVDVHQWDFAYECLSESSRKEIGRFQFEAAVRFARDPVFHDLYLYDMISGALSDHGQPLFDAPRQLAKESRIKVFPDVIGPDGTHLVHVIDLYFVLEGNEWKLDFLKSMEEGGAGGGGS
jgi:hypothetical protein